MKVFNLRFGSSFPEYDVKSKVILETRCQKCRRVLGSNQDACTEFEYPIVASIKAKDRESQIFIGSWNPIIASPALCDSLSDFGVRFSAQPCLLRYKLKGQLQEIKDYFAVVPTVRHHMDPYAVALSRLIDCSECGGTRWRQVGHQIPYPFTGDKSDFHFFVSDLLEGAFTSEELLRYLSGRFFPSGLSESLDPYGTWSNSVCQGDK